MSTPRAARSANAIAVVASKKLASSRSMWGRRNVVHSANASSPIGTPSTTMRSRTDTRCGRSEEHTSELQSHSDLVCRLLLEKKKKQPENRKVQREAEPPTSPDRA